MPQNRQTVRTNLVLSDEHASRLTQQPETYRLMLYCGHTGLSNYTALDVAFPNQIEVKVNDDDVKANFKGLKNKPGSTKPADITKMVRPRAGYANKLSVCYALTTKRFAFTVVLVRYVSADALVQKIRSARVIPKFKVLEEMNRINADPDLAATSSKMSLKDPISTLRITVPVRSTVCQHNQCFDASMFMQLQEQAPTWNCPICTKTVSFESLCVDKYFEEILESTSRSIEQVTIEPNGVWRVVKEDEEKGMSNVAKGGTRASYDDDFDDDVIPVEAPNPTMKTEGLHVGRDWNASASNAFNTPPLSSREPSVPQSSTTVGNTNGTKRGSHVIDLTLSEDEDAPPRPAKRVATAAAAGRPSLSCQTPTSLPGQRAERDGNPGSAAFQRQPSRHSVAQPSTQCAYGSGGALRSPINLSPYNPPAAPIPSFSHASNQSPRPPSRFGPSNSVPPPSWDLHSPSATYRAPAQLSRPPSLSQSPPRPGADRSSAAPPPPPPPPPLGRLGDPIPWRRQSGSGSTVRLPALQHPSFPSAFPSAAQNPWQGLSPEHYQHAASPASGGGTGWRAPSGYGGDSQSPG